MLARKAIRILEANPDSELLVRAADGTFRGVVDIVQIPDRRNALLVIPAGTVRFHVEEGSDDPTGNTPVHWSEIPNGVYDTRAEAEARVKLERDRAGHNILIRIVEK